MSTTYGIPLSSTTQIDPWSFVDPITGNNTPADGVQIQVSYQRLYEIYLRIFPDKAGQLYTLVKLYNQDYRRAIFEFEMVCLQDETERLNNLFKGTV